MLAAVTRNLETRLVHGLEANRERATAFVEQSLATATVLAPIIGYEQATALAKEVSASGRTIREVARERSGIPPADLERLPGVLRPEPAASPLCIVRLNSMMKIARGARQR